MADGEVLVSGGEASENGEFIFDRLPSWMPSDEGSGNFKLLDVVGRAFDRLDGDLNDLDNATTVQDAETVEQLQSLARIVDLPPKQNEDLEKYRTRTIAEFQTLTSEGTIRDILRNTATLLDIDITSVRYAELNENGVIQITVPGKALGELSIEDTEFVDIIKKHAAAGFRIEAARRGTFTYITPSNYGSSDASLGYDGLDASDDPKDNGGTYAGII